MPPMFSPAIAQRSLQFSCKQRSHLDRCTAKSKNNAADRCRPPPSNNLQLPSLSIVNQQPATHAKTEYFKPLKLGSLHLAHPLPHLHFEHPNS